MSFVTPLRYPGGKGRLGYWLAQLMRHNRISGGWYVEPYAGGAGAAVMLLTHGYVNRVVINDADPVVHAFWAAMLHDTEHFLRLVEETPVTMDTWYQQKEVHANSSSYSTTEIGFATFFLNRTNRSGILCGGVIGGKNQTGPYGLDARYNKNDLVNRISSIASLREKIDIHCLDAMELLNMISSKAPTKCLFYLDPPYYVKGSQLYRNHYAPDDHKKIADAIQDCSHPWLVTYDNCEEIRSLYQRSNSIEFSLHYSTHLARPKASELMFYNNLEVHQQPFLKR